ncbi:MAG: Pr6Pr family membrane protein [Kineosporiaceae bacterium]
MTQTRPAAAPGRAGRDPVIPTGAAAYHLTTAVVVTAGLLLQVGLAVTAGGDAVPVRLLRLASHFTVQAALLVAVTSWMLAARPARGISPVFRVVRLGAVVASIVTGLVYLVVLRPVVDLEGWAAVADVVLHYVVPALVTVGWLVYGPRRRVDRRAVLLSIVWPVAFFAWTLGHGAVTGYSPYPFTDVDALGLATVLGRATVGTAVLAVLAAALWWLDRRLDERARRPRWG